MVCSMTERPTVATQPPLALPPRLQHELEQSRDLARFVYRADQRLKREPISVLTEAIPTRVMAQIEARARVAVRLGDPVNVTGAVEAATQAILVDIADRVANRVLDAGDGETCIDADGARHLAKVAYEAAFNHLAALHLLGREK